MRSPVATVILVVVAVLLGVFVSHTLASRADDNDLTPDAMSAIQVDLGTKQLNATVDCQMTHSVTWCNDHLPSWDEATHVSATQPDAWPVRHARLVGVIAGVAVLVVGRLWLFMVRLESRPR